MTEVSAVGMRHPRVAIRGIAEEGAAGTFSTLFIVTKDVAMKSVAAIFASELLATEPNELRAGISKDMADPTNSYPDVIVTIVTGDESRV
jgi:hypothetical protein